MPARQGPALKVPALHVIGALLAVQIGAVTPARAAPATEAMSCAQLHRAMWRERDGLGKAARLAAPAARKDWDQVMATGGPSRALKTRAGEALDSVLAGGFKSKDSKAALKALARQASDDLDNRHHIPRSQLMQDFAPAALAGAPSYARLKTLREASRRKGCKPKL